MTVPYCREISSGRKRKLGCLATDELYPRKDRLIQSESRPARPLLILLQYGGRIS